MAGEMALAAYRHLLRATRIAFQGDFHLLHAARLQARAGFDKASSLDPSSGEAGKAIAHAEGVAQILRQNIVQGVQNEGEETMSMLGSRTFVLVIDFQQSYGYMLIQRGEIMIRSRIRWCRVGRSRLEVHDC